MDFDWVVASERARAEHFNMTLDRPTQHNGNFPQVRVENRITARA
jgi:hypothetical protein